jgi:hypothetical protein
VVANQDDDVVALANDVVALAVAGEMLSERSPRRSPAEFITELG